MQRNIWFRVIPLAALFIPGAGRAQSPKPIIKEIAAITGLDMQAAIKMPNGHMVIYAADDSIAAYDLTSKKTTLIAKGWNGDDIALSPTGDRVAYTRDSADGDSTFVWTIAIGPATGAPARPAQRLTMGTSDLPGFSPDGKLIAFDGGHCPKSCVSVIPATGGTERLLDQTENGINEISWSDDGKWIYATFVDQKTSIASIERIPSAGGKSERLLSYPKLAGSDGTVDGKIAFYAPRKEAWYEGVRAYQAAGGAHGEFSVPFSASAGTMFTSAHSVLMKTSYASVLYAINLTDGKSREVNRKDEERRYLSWSVDGHRIAYVGGSWAKPELVVANSDGSGEQRFPVAGEGTVTGASSWAPDGNSLVYFANGGLELRVLNISTGVSHILQTYTAPNSIGFPGVWQADGKSFLVHSRDVPPTGFPTKSAIVEISLDGKTRILRDLHAEFPESKHTYFASNRTAIVVMGDSSKQLHMLRVPVDGGRSQPITMPAFAGPNLLVRWAAASDKWYVATLVTGGSVHALLAIPRDGDSAVVIPLAPNTYQGEPVLVFPGQDRIAMVGKTPGDTGRTLFSVSLKTGQASTIGMLPGGWLAQYGGVKAISPDGKTFAILVSGTPTTHLFDIDLTPIISSAVKN